MASFVKVCPTSDMDAVTRWEDRSLHRSTTSQDPSPDASLYRDYMNWAEDVDETLNKAHLPLNFTLNPPQLQSKLSRLYNARIRASRGARFTKFHPSDSISTISEETEDLSESSLGSNNTDPTLWEDIGAEPDKKIGNLPASPCELGDTKPISFNMILEESDEPSNNLSLDKVTSLGVDRATDTSSEDMMDACDAELSSTERTLRPTYVFMNGSDWYGSLNQEEIHGESLEVNLEEIYGEPSEAKDVPLTSATESNDVDQDSGMVWDELNDPTRELLIFRDPTTNQEVLTGHCPSNDCDEPHSAAQCSVDNIFADREAWMRFDEDIHHFNWMGMQVHTHSSTSPTDSLAIILATPKIPRGTEFWRMLSVLNRAIQYIDPVLVIMDDAADERLFALRGSALVRGLTGKVFKYYSPHGRWMEDPRDSSEETTTDFGNIQTYEATDLAIGNGFMESGLIRSYPEWVVCRDEVFDNSEKANRSSRNAIWEPKPSPLSQCETIPCLDIGEVEPKKNLPPTKRPRPRITTCVTGAVPEEYFSFPTPVFGRRRALKSFIEKARRKVTNLLSPFKKRQK